MSRRVKRTLLISLFFFLTLVLIQVAGFLHDQSLWPYSHHRHPIEPFEVIDLRDSISKLDTRIHFLEARRPLSFASDNSEASTRLDAETKIREAQSIGGDFRGKQSNGGTLFIGHAYGSIDNEQIPYPPLKSFLDKFLGNHDIARLVFLGDLTPKPKDTPAFIQFLKPYTATKIFIAGNHDNNLQLFNHVEEVSEFRIGNNTVKTINFIDHTQLLLHNPTEIFSRPYDIYLSHYGIFHPLLPTRLWKDPFDDYVNRYSDLGETFNSGPREVSKSEWGRAHFMAFGQSEGRQLYDPTRDKGFNNMYGVPLEYLTSVFYKLFALKDRIFISGDCGAGVIESRDYIFEVVDRKLLLCTGMGSGAGGDNALYMDAASMRFLFFDANGDILREEIVYDLN